MNPTLLQGFLFLALVFLLIVREIEKDHARHIAEKDQRITDLKESNKALNAMLDRKEYGSGWRGGDR